MAFEELLGNQRLKDNLIPALRRGKISHFYLISGPVGSGKRTLARLLAAAILCQGQEKPCLHCNPCRKVLSGNHPDFITVDDPEKKTVSVELIRQARMDIYIQPNESDRKIYLFPRAQDMGIPGQNALLKVLEEPPKYGVFILLCDNPAVLLPTVRSRCTELSLTALPERLLREQLTRRFPDAQAEDLSAAIARSGGYLGQAITLLEQGSAPSKQTENFAAAFASSDAMLLMQTTTSMEKWKREQLIAELTQWAELLESALLSHSGIPPLSPLARRLGTSCTGSRLMDAIQKLQKTIVYAQGNVSVAAICGYLEHALR